MQKEGKTMGPVELQELIRKRKRRKVLDNRQVGERTPAEEEGIRATEGMACLHGAFWFEEAVDFSKIQFSSLIAAMDQILVRLSRSDLVTGKSTDQKLPAKELVSSTAAK